MEQARNPILPQNRGSIILALNVGGFSVLVGLAVLIGWHTNNPCLIQSTSTVAALAYKIALALLLSGAGGVFSVAIVLVQKERHKTHLLNEINQVLTREIAQHQQTEEALRKQTDIQRTIFACMSEDMIVADAQGKILLMNRAAQQTLGVSLADTLADAPVLDWSRLAHIYLPDQQTPFPPEDLPLLRALRGEVVNDCEQFILHPGASEGVWRSVNGRPLRDAEGRVCGGIIVGRNITERKRTEEALQKQTEILHSILDNLADGVILADAEKPLFFNPAAERIFGQSVTDAKSDVWAQQYNIYLPDMTTPFPNEELPIIQAIGGMAVDKVEMFVRHADPAKSIWTEVSGRPLKDQTGVVQGGVVVCRDITDRKQAEMALRESEERFRSLCTASPVGVFQNDVTGACVYTNSRWQEITGMTPEESLGQGWTKAIHCEDRESVFAEWQAGVARGSDFAKEFRCVRSTGEVCWVYAKVSPLRADDGSVSGYVGVTMDITDRKEMDRLKDEFVSMVSHELRTPLTSIRGSLGLLASGRLGTLQEKGQRMLDIAVANTDRLVRLINDILDIERLQSGKIAMQKQECNVADLMSQAAEVMRAMAEKAAVTLSVAPLSTRLWADPDRILQILTNLLSNAIKFSSRGSTVWLSAEHQEGHLRFAVKDQGRGIPVDKLDSIFERFQQVDASDSRDKGGTGLGLAICRSIVQQHGGQIGVESTLGVGSTFSFTLPALNRAETIAPEVSPSVITHPMTGRSKTACVLVAEDDSDLVKVLDLMLQRYSIESFYARTGREAIQLSQRLCPDLIILDLFMPDGDGFMVVNWLRQQNSLRQVPLIVYSAKDLDAEERERLKLGPTQFFTKGRVKPEEFEQRVIEFLNHILAQRG